MKEFTKGVLAGIGIITTLVLLGIILIQIPEKKPSLEIKSDCFNLSLPETSICLRNDLSKWFAYNISNIGKDLTLEQLKAEGGTCLQASEFYINTAKGLGFQGNRIDFYSKDNQEGHSIALIYENNLTAYCILDQKYLIGCGSLG